MKSRHHWSAVSRPSLLGVLMEDRWRRRLLWIALALLAFLPPLFSQRGRYVADTKLPLWFATPRYLLNSLKVWQATPYLGHEQHDGVMFPMATIVAILRAIGLPVWVAERLWHGLLLFIAAVGTVLLVDLYTGKRLTLAQPVAAALYAFNPYTFGFGLHGSGVFVPYALLPLLFLVWVRGLRQPQGWLWPAIVSLVFFAMGGGNGAPQVYALIPLMAYLAWAVFVEHSVRLSEAVAFAAKAGAMVVALNIYWLVGLTTQGVANDIAFTEQPKVINSTSSLSESVRLLGFWGFYGVDRYGPWYPVLTRFLLSPLVVLASFAVPVLAFASAWRSPWRQRTFFVLLAVLAVVVMSGIYPVHRPTPFGHALLRAYDEIPGASGLRTTYKFGSALALSLAVLAGIGTAEMWRSLRGSARRRSLGPVTLVVVVGVIAGTTVPVWTADLYQHSRTIKSIPRYWQQAVSDLQRASGGERVFFAPGGLFAYYSWGGPLGGIPEANPQVQGVRRTAVPIMQRYGSDLLAAIEQPYQLGPYVPGATAALLRRLGVRFVVLQNDLDFARSNTARPSDLQLLMGEPGLEREAAYGAPGENVPGSGPLSSRDRALAKSERRLRPVQVLRLVHPVPILRAEGGPPVVVSGDAFGLPPALAAGLIGADQPILYSGNLTDGTFQAIAADHPAFIITDSNRRRSWNFSAVRDNISYTLPAHRGGNALGYNLFRGRLNTQTVARYLGVTFISASSSGNPFSLQPWIRPANAFDSDPRTAWGVNGLTSPVGQWVQVDFTSPIDLSHVTIDPHVGPRGSRQLSSVRLRFSDGSVVSRSVARGPTTLSFAARTTRSLRIEIAGIVPGPFGGLVGIDDVFIPGISSSTALALPTDLVDLADRSQSGRDLMASAPLAFVFDRSRTNGSVPDEEDGLDRIFRVPSPRLFDLHGQVRLDPAATDQELDRILLGRTDVVASSSGRAGNNPANRASLALDGDPATGWTAAGTTGQWVQVNFPNHPVGRLSILAFTDGHHSIIERVRIDLSDGTSIERPIGPKGDLMVSFPKRDLTSVRVTILSAGLPPSLVGQPLPAGIRELRIPRVALQGFPSASSTPLGCYRGPGVLLDGQPLDVKLDTGVGALLRGDRFQIESCDRGPISLDPGVHELKISGVLKPASLTLAAGFGPGSGQTAPVPRLSVKRSSAGYVIEVRNASAPYYLVLGQNVSSAWQATIDGRSLGAPLVLDGFAAGWRVERPGDYTIVVTYRAQSRQNIAFVVSAVALPGTMAIAAVGWRRRRKRRAATTEDSPEAAPMSSSGRRSRRRPRWTFWGGRSHQGQREHEAASGGAAGARTLHHRLRRAIGALGFVFIAFFFGGVVGAVIGLAVSALWFRGGRPVLFWLLGLASLVAAPISMLVQGLPTGVAGPSYGPRHWVAHLLVGIALAAFSMAALLELPRPRPAVGEGTSGEI